VLIRFYRTASGASPVEKYLAGLEAKERAAVAAARLQEAGQEGTAAGDRGCRTADAGSSGRKRIAEKRAPEGATERYMASRARRKRNRHIGRSLNELIREQREKDPEFAVEFDRLEVARLVRDLRERKKVSQGELAARVGTKQPAIARLESGRVVPKLDLLGKVARALGRRLAVRFVASGTK